MELTDYKALPVDQIAQSLFGTPTEGNARSQWIRWRNTPLGTVSVHRGVRPGERYQWWTASTLLNPNQGAKNALNLVLAVQNAGTFPTDPAAVARACRALDHLGGIAPVVTRTQSSRLTSQTKGYVPMKDNHQAWPQVEQYLTQIRHLPQALIPTWHTQGQIRAIAYGRVPYVVFPLRNTAGDEVGAVLRCAGTPEQQRQQLAQGYAVKRVATGSQPDKGFWQSHASPQAQTLVLVESPIDAMALYAVMVTAHKDPQTFVIRASTGSALNAQHWQGHWSHLIAAFDQDAAGEAFAHKVRQEAPVAVHRLTPPQGRKDWAEAWARVQDRSRNREAESPAHPRTRTRSRPVAASHEYEPGD